MEVFSMRLLKTLEMVRHLGFTQEQYVRWPYIDRTANRGVPESKHIRLQRFYCFPKSALLQVASRGLWSVLCRGQCLKHSIIRKKKLYHMSLMNYSWSETPWYHIHWKAPLSQKYSWPGGYSYAEWDFEASNVYLFKISIYTDTWTSRFKKI